jgi:DNA-binding Lrp family transcriptional regulator
MYIGNDYHAGSINKLDSKDMYILQEIMENSRVSHKELSTKINLSRNTIDKRIKNLKQNNVLGTSRPFLNVYTLGFSHFIIFMEKPELYFDKSKLKKLKQNKHILEIVMQYGQYNCYIRFVSKSLEQKENFISELLSLISPKSYEVTESTHFDIIPSKRNYDSKVIIPKNYQIPNKSQNIFTIDKIDKDILSKLGEDADMNYAVIGRELGYSTQLVISRIKKLISEKVLLFFYGECAIKNSGRTFYFLRFENRDYSKNKILFEYLIFSKYVNHVDILSSTKNFLCILNTNSQSELETFIQELLVKFDQIESLTIDLYIGNLLSNFQSKILFE